MPTNIVGSVSSVFGNATAKNQAVLTTGSQSRAVSSIERELGIEFDPDKQFTEGSFIKYEGLEPGVYSIQFQFDSLDAINPDGLVIVKDGKIEQIITTIQFSEYFTEGQPISLAYEIVYGDLAIVLLDSVNKSNTSVITISEILKTADLSFPVPKAINLEAADIIGDFSKSEELIEIRTGSSSRAISSIGRYLDFTLELELATEGTVAKFDKSMGRYKIYWELETYEPEGSAKDIFYVWNGREFWALANSGDATNQITNARRTTGLMTTEVEIYDILGLFVVDTEDSTKTSTVNISKIELIQPFSNLEFLAHRTLIQAPMNLASKALIAHKKQENYELAYWQQDWQWGYNWYWQQLSPLGDENNNLAEEVRKMDFEKVLWKNELFRKEFLDSWAIAAHTLRHLYLENPDGGTETHELSVLDVLGATNAAIAVIRLHYELASEIGLWNNIEENEILNQIIPSYVGRLNVAVQQASYFNPENGAYVQMPVEWIISMIYTLSSQNFKLESNMIFNPFNGFNEIYQLWRNSWGLD